MFITCGMSNIGALWHEPSAVRCFDLQPLLVDPTHPDVLHHRNALRIDHHHAQRRVRLTWNGRTGERLTTCARCRRARGRGSSAPSMLRSTSTACVPKLVRFAIRHMLEVEDARDDLPRYEAVVVVELGRGVSQTSLRCVCRGHRCGARGNGQHTAPEPRAAACHHRPLSGVLVLRAPLHGVLLTGVRSALGT